MIAPPASATPVLRRSSGDRMVAGVCGGLAEALGVDAWIVRAAFVAGVLVGGLGLALYAGAALAMERPAARSGGLPQEAPALAMLIGAILLGLERNSALIDTPALAAIALLLGGLGLIWRRGGRDRAPGDVAGWARPAASDAVRVIGGVGLVVGGGVLLLQLTGGVASTGLVVVTAAAVAAGIGLLVGPRLRSARAEAEAVRAESIRVEERERVAAQLHDSVLQTLALIQRSDDGRRAQALARRQERELRSWLYGDVSPDAPRTFAAALRAAAEEVEERHGVVIDLVQPSDAPLDARLNELVAAAGEAMTNAAKHARVEQISVLARIAEGDASVFVRDRGAGFEMNGVAGDRLGIRESIVARMARVGGRASIHSTPGQGTEVELTLPGEDT